MRRLFVHFSCSHNRHRLLSLLCVLFITLSYLDLDCFFLNHMLPVYQFIQLCNRRPLTKRGFLCLTSWWCWIMWLQFFAVWELKLWFLLIFLTSLFFVTRTRTLFTLLGYCCNGSHSNSRGWWGATETTFLFLAFLRLLFLCSTTLWFFLWRLGLVVVSFWWGFFVHRGQK